MDVEEQERIDSVNRYIRGDKPVNICRDLGRSKTWLFTWVSRFENGEEEWYKSQSRAPKKSTIVNIRKALMEGNEHESKYHGVGADAIQYEW
jgi:transposase-like protein